MHCAAVLALVLASGPVLPPEGCTSDPLASLLDDGVSSGPLFPAPWCTSTTPTGLPVFQLQSALVPSAGGLASPIIADTGQAGTFTRGSVESCFPAAGNSMVTLTSGHACVASASSIEGMGGLFLDSAAVNDQLASGAIGGTSWSLSNATAATNVAVSPDGTTTTSQFLSSSIFGLVYGQPTFGSTSGPLTASSWVSVPPDAGATPTTALFLENVAGGSLTCACAVAGGTCTAQTYNNGGSLVCEPWITATTSPVRLQATITLQNATTSLYAGVTPGVFATNNGFVSAAWGYQFESGTYATNLKPTVSGTVSGAADQLSFSTDGGTAGAIVTPAAGAVEVALAGTEWSTSNVAADMPLWYVSSTLNLYYRHTAGVFELTVGNVVVDTAAQSWALHTAHSVNANWSATGSACIQVDSATAVCATSGTAPTVGGTFFVGSDGTSALGGWLTSFKLYGYAAAIPNTPTYYYAATFAPAGDYSSYTVDSGQPIYNYLSTGNYYTGPDGGPQLPAIDRVRVDGYGLLSGSADGGVDTDYSPLNAQVCDSNQCTFVIVYKPLLASSDTRQISYSVLSGLNGMSVYWEPSTSQWEWRVGSSAVGFSGSFSAGALQTIVASYNAGAINLTVNGSGTGSSVGTHGASAGQIIIGGDENTGAGYSQYPAVGEIVSLVAYGDGKPGKNVECLGDSITKGLGVTTPYPSTLLASLPSTYTVSNDGWSGQDTAHMMARYFEAGGAASVAENAIVLMGGTNDCSSNYLEQPATIEANINAIVADALGKGEKVVLLAIPPYDGSVEYAGYADGGGVALADGGTYSTQLCVNAVNAWESTYVGGANFTWINTYAALGYTDGGDPAALNPNLGQGDNLHPSQVGANLIAALVFSDGGLWR